MDVELLHRLQFALTISFHFIFPPMSMGLGLVLLIFGVQSVRTKDPKWRRLSLFWTKIYGLIFAMGIATGIVQEFQFGTNWSVYSRFVGNVFGSLLAAEGIFAFMLEGGFLGLMLFGGSRLGNRLWLFATTMVVIGSHFSALWIMMANSWMQTPQGFEIRNVGQGPQAFMTGFLDVVFTPSFVPRLLHVWFASWIAGAALVLSVAAYYLLRRRHEDVARTIIRVALPVFAVAAVLQVLLIGSNQGVEVANNQPVKLAAMEGVWTTGDCVPMNIVGWVNEDKETTTGIKIPCLLSLLVGYKPSTVVKGLKEFPKDEWPNVNLVFQVYHVMINLAVLMAAIGVVAWFLLWRRRLWTARWMLVALVATIVLAQLSIQTGWWTAEFGRQPWIVYGQLRTADAFSPNVTAAAIASTIGMFILLYGTLFTVFLWLLNKHIHEGPDEESELDHESLPDSFGEVFRRRPPRASRGVEEEGQEVMSGAD